MNERDVPQFDLRGVKSILERFNELNENPIGEFFSSEPEFPLDIEDIDYLAKRIIEYAARCGVIPSQSTMK